MLLVKARVMLLDTASKLFAVPAPCTIIYSGAYGKYLVEVCKCVVPVVVGVIKGGAVH